MRIRLLLCTISAAARLLPAQPSTDTVTVTVSQDSGSQPNQVVFNLVVTSGTGQSLNDVLGPLAGIGVSAANLTGVTFLPAQRSPPQLQWNFQLTAPLSNLKATTAALTALVKSIPQTNSALSFTFAVQYAQSSGAQTQNCDYAALMSNARVQAQSLANAAGYIAGRVLAISSTTAQGVGACAATVKFGVGTPGPHAIQITSSRTQTSAPDQAVFEVNVYSNLTSGIDDVTNALSQAGVSGASFTGIQNYCIAASVLNSCQQPLDWSFTLTAPLSGLTSALAQLVTAQAAIATSGMTLDFFIGYLQTSAQAQPACPQSALLADATAQAQALAAGAAASVGPIDGVSFPGATPYSVLTVGNFVSFSPPACSVVVQFGLY